MTKQEQILTDSRYVPVHNHGFVGLIDTMGDDHDICEAARVSYGAGTKSVNDDRNLIRYLMRHWHTSPFEMAEVKFHLKLPIFVMRQLVRHRTANLNEYSGRYSEMSDEFYVPDGSYLAPQALSNKQGRLGQFSEDVQEAIRTTFEYGFEKAYDIYSKLIGTQPDPNGVWTGDSQFSGLARELSRIVLPLANYTELYWKCDLHNFFHFARLRMDEHAQREIRDFATTMYELVKPHFPLSAEAFEDYRFYGKALSRMDIQALIDMLQGTFVPTAAHYQMSKREYTELVEFFKPSADHSRNAPLT